MTTWRDDAKFEGKVATQSLGVGGAPPVTTQPAIADVTGSGGSVVDVESRAAIDAILAVLRTYGLITGGP